MSFPLLLLGLLGNLTLSAQTEARGVELLRRQFDAFRQEPRVAVVVAVDQYPEESGFRRLEFAAKDAEALAQALSGPDFNYKVRTIVNQQAVRTVVRGALKNAAAMVDGKGTLLFFFAGHGGQKDGKQYLATYETGADRLDEFGLPLSEIRALLDAANAPRKIMIVDACRNEPTVAASRSAGDTLQRFGRLEESKGLRILNATGPAQVSYEDPKLAHGVFSYFLLKGLQGQAADSYGLVTFRGLADFVSREVRDFSYPSGRLQVPYEAGDAFGDFLLGGSLKERPAETSRSAAADPALAQRAQKMLQEALNRFYAGESERPLASLETATQLDPSNQVAAGYWVLLRSYYNPGLATLEAAERVLKAQPDNMPAVLARAINYSQSTRPEKAKPDLGRVIHWSPTDAHGYFLRGLAHAIAHQDEPAIADYSEVIRREPGWSFPSYLRGGANLRARRFDDARRDYTEAIKLNPDFEAAFYGRGFMYASQKRYREALRDLSESIRLNPDSKRAIDVRERVLEEYWSDGRSRIKEAATRNIEVMHVHNIAPTALQKCSGILLVLDGILTYTVARPVDGEWDDFEIPLRDVQEIKVNPLPVSGQRSFHVTAGGKTFTFLPRSITVEQAVAEIERARK